MLIGLLNLLKKPEKYSLKEMAEFFKTDVSAIKVELKYLEQKGYIKGWKE